MKKIRYSPISATGLIFLEVLGAGSSGCTSIRPTVIQVTNQRPMSATVNEIRKSYGAAISYSELQEGTSNWRDKVPSSFEIKMPRSLHAILDRKQLTALIRQTPGGSAFSVVEVGGALAVVENQGTTVTIPMRLWNGLDLLAAIRNAFGPRVLGGPLPVELLMRNSVEFGGEGSPEVLLLRALHALGIEQNIAFDLFRTFDGRWTELRFKAVQVPTACPSATDPGAEPNGETSNVIKWDENDVASFCAKLVPTRSYGDLDISECFTEVQDDCLDLAKKNGGGILPDGFCSAGMTYTWNLRGLYYYVDSIGKANDYSAYYMSFTKNQPCRIHCLQTMSFNRAGTDIVYKNNDVTIDLSPGGARICRDSACKDRPKPPFPLPGNCP